jgi:excisionase family DNA binding protein
VTGPRQGTYGPSVYGDPSGVVSPPGFQRGRASNEAAGLRPHPAGQAEVLMTVAEVAAVLRVSKMTVYRLIHDQELAAARVRRSFRVSSTAVDRYVQGAGLLPHPAQPTEEASCPSTPPR